MLSAVLHINRYIYIYMYMYTDIYAVYILVAFKMFTFLYSDFVSKTSRSKRWWRISSGTPTKVC
jgi:hypothetical protein